MPHKQPPSAATVSPEVSIQDAADTSAIDLTIRPFASRLLPSCFSELAKEGKLRHLKHLLIHGALEELPPEIAFCENLRELDLQITQLSTLPGEIVRLKRLERLIIGGNQFKTLPEVIWSLLNLKELIIIHAPISSLSPKIQQLKRLRSLYFLHVPIVELPPALGLLKLRNFSINSSGIYSDFPDRKLRFPPLDVQDLGGEAMLRYLKAAQRGCRDLWESKLLLVGEGSVGKTSVFRALKGQLIDKSETSEGTVGIAIGQLDLDHPTSHNKTMRLNAWDFAGQDFNHATHQFFFSNRSLFLVVWNARKGWEQCKLHGWLENIRDRAPQAQIIVVATHIDQPHSDYPEQKLRDQFTQIVGTASVSSREGTGIPELKELVRKYAAELPMMGLRWPTDWLSAAEAIRPLRRRQHASRTEVIAIFKKKGLTEDDADVLLRWLHELGEVLYFPEVPALREIVTLDPEWVTRNVGIVLRCEAVQKHHGLLQQTDLNHLWPEIQEHVRLYLLRLMDHFDLAYLIPDDPENRSLIVERLPQNPPKYEQRWKEWEKHGQELRLRIRLKTMHPGIPTWFLARCHRFTLGLHWLSGVVFGDVAEGVPEERNPRHLALVIADRTERTVDFTIRGPFPQKLMTLLTDGFGDTLRRYPGLEERRLVPCPGKKRDNSNCSYEFPVGTLEDRLLRAAPRRTVECTECETVHNVEKLLFGLDPGAATEPYINELLVAVHAEGKKNRSHITKAAKLVHKTVRKEGKFTRNSIAGALEDFNADFREFMELRFIQEFNEEQRLEEHSIPSVFALYPVDNATFFHSKKMRLQLYCMQPGCWHSVGEPGATQFAPVKGWLREAAPYLLTLRKTMMFSTHLLKPGIGMLAKSAAEAKGLYDSTKESMDLSIAALKELEALKIPEALPPIPGAVTNSEIDFPVSPRHIRRYSGANLDSIRAILRSATFPQPWGGLKRVRTPEGHIFWVCEHHHQFWLDPRQLEIEHRKAKLSRSS